MPAKNSIKRPAATPDNDQASMIRFCPQLRRLPIFPSTHFGKDRAPFQDEELVARAKWLMHRRGYSDDGEYVRMLVRADYDRYHNLLAA